jgi:Cysteine rich repeat
LIQIKLGWKQTPKLGFLLRQSKTATKAAVQKLCANVSFREVAMLARHLFGVCTFLVSALVTLPAIAQDRPQDYNRAVSAACSKEINGQCKGVPDRRGQLLACLYQRQASLSPRCKATILSTMQRFGKTLANVEAVRRECDRDSQQWCKETISGSGNLLSCFLRAKHVISPQCRPQFVASGTGKDGSSAMC